MKHERVIPLTDDFKIIINHSPSLPLIPHTIQEHIEDIWKKEIVRTRGRVFNGQLLSAETLHHHELHGHFVEYKHLIAQLRDPSLKEILNVQPICVCGYTLAGDSILIGKRAAHVTDYPNLYELVPSGGVDPSAIVRDQVNIIHQLKIELKEEAGIEENMIDSILPSFLIICSESCTYEICAKIELNTEVKNREAERDEEYTELKWIPKTMIKKFIQEQQEKIIPLSLQILDLF